MQFGAWEDVDLSQEISPKLERTPATEQAHSDNFAKVQAQIHVFPCSKFNKKGNFVFSSLSSKTEELSLKEGTT